MELWSWGANSHGQLGLGLINEQVCVPSKVSLEYFGANIKQIACGGGHTLLLDENGQLYSCGENSKMQLGRENNTSTFERVWHLSGIKFISVSCGWDFCCGVTDDKFLFVWGSNSYGQLGLPKTHFRGNVLPVRLQVIAQAVSMGLRHTALINSNGDVWVTGCGRHGQLGLGKDILSSSKFVKVPKVSQISHIACGQNCTAAWCTKENALYVWGDNRHGQLLLDKEKYRKIYDPQKIDIDVKQHVKKLLSGWTHFILWLEDGKLLTWGSNRYGQLGNSDLLTNKIVHLQLPDGRIAKDIAVGSEHAICLASDNTLWAWGWNEHGNTGTNIEEQYVTTPTLVPVNLESPTSLSRIYAGSAHNFIIIEKQVHNVDEN